MKKQQKILYGLSLIHILEDYYGSAGTREQKAEDMMAMLKDKEVKAIICLEGGETCNTFIDLLDYEIKMCIRDRD